MDDLGATLSTFAVAGLWSLKTVSLLQYSEATYSYVHCTMLFLQDKGGNQIPPTNDIVLFSALIGEKISFIF